MNIKIQFLVNTNRIEHSTRNNLYHWIMSHLVDFFPTMHNSNVSASNSCLRLGADDPLLYRSSSDPILTFSILRAIRSLRSDPRAILDPAHEQIKIRHFTKIVTYDVTNSLFLFSFEWSHL